MSYVIEIDAYRLSDGAIETLRYTSGRGFTTRPTDTPPNTYIAPRISQPLLARRDLFDRATTYGRTAAGAGEIRLINADGGLDTLLTGYALNGRALRAWIGLETTTWPASWVQVMAGRVDTVGQTGNELVIRLRDELATLDKPLLPTTYAGNNALPAGLEGVADDLKGKRKPRVLGKVINISPYCVNTSKLIYQLSDQACSVTGVFDRGAALTAGAAYATLADVQATAPSAGQYRVYAGSEGTYLRLGSTPSGELTCDAAASETRAASQAAAVATAMGAALASGDVTALNSANSAAVGVWVTDDMSALDALDALLGSLGAWYGYDRTGQLRAARLEAPAASADAVIDPAAVMDVTLVSTGDGDKGVPAYRIALGYGHNYTTQTDTAGAAAADRRAWLGQQERTAASENGNRTIWPDAAEIAVSSYLTASSDAQAEADRRLALYGVARQMLEVRIRAARVTVQAFDIGQTVSLTWPRFGLATGKRFRVVGLQTNFQNRELLLRLWG